MHTTIEFGRHTYTVQVPLAQKQAHNSNPKLKTY